MHSVWLWVHELVYRTVGTPHKGEDVPSLPAIATAAPLCDCTSVPHLWSAIPPPWRMWQ